MLFCALPAAQAATYLVSNCADSGVGSLRQAINNANDAPGADTVVFNLNPLCSNISLQTEIAIGGDLEIQGPGAQLLTITNASGRIFAIQPSAPSPAFQAVAMRGIRFTGSSDAGGGAILASRSNLSIQESVFANNDANTGGAIFFTSDSETLRTLFVENSTFVANGASSILSGGAIAAANSFVTIRGSLFRQNGRQATPGAGGAVAVSGGVLLVTDSAFYSNRSSRGGAIAFIETTSGAPSAIPSVRIDNTSFVGNVATGTQPGGFGGGAISGSLGLLRLENNTFSANTVQGAGFGAAIDMRGGTMTLINNTAAKNRVDSTQPQNAAIAAFAQVAGGDGDNTPVNVTLRNTVATGTVALDPSKGADVWVSASAAGNDATLDSQFSLVSSLRAPSGTTTVTPADPLLSVAADRGGSRPGASGATEASFTHTPLVGSPLIDAGSNVAATLENDQRGSGFPRINGSAIDIGAIESAAEPVVVLPTSVPMLSNQNMALLVLALLVAVTIRRKAIRS